MDMAASSSVLINGVRLGASALAAVSASKGYNPIQISAYGAVLHPFSLCTCSALRVLKNQKIKETSISASFHGRLGGTGGGAGVLERPGLDQSQYDPTPSAEEGGEIGKVRQKRGSGGGDRYRVLLLDHERHTESQVATILPKVVPSITFEEAKRCFYESRQTGVSLVIVTVKIVHCCLYSIWRMCAIYAKDNDEGLCGMGNEEVGLIRSNSTIIAATFGN